MMDHAFTIIQVMEDSTAINYDPFATFDDGSCQYASSTICTEPVPSGLFVNEIVHDRAKIN